EIEPDTSLRQPPGHRRSIDADEQREVVSLVVRSFSDRIHFDPRPRSRSPPLSVQDRDDSRLLAENGRKLLLTVPTGELFLSPGVEERLQSILNEIVNLGRELLVLREEREGDVVPEVCHPPRPRTLLLFEAGP